MEAQYPRSCEGKIAQGHHYSPSYHSHPPRRTDGSRIHHDLPSFSRMAPGQPGYGWFDIQFWWYKQSIWITVGYHVGWLWNREVQRVCLSHWCSSKKTLTILISWTHFLVVITTHAEPQTGFLHTAPGNTGSVSVEEVSFNSFSIHWIILIYQFLFQLFNFIFLPRFHDILKRSPTNILMLLACGALSAQPASRKMIKEISSTCVHISLWHK